MKNFKNYLNEEGDSNTTLLNYITASFYKLSATDSNVDLKPMILLLAATIMSSMDDAKATQMARRLAQLAVSKSNKNVKDN